MITDKSHLFINLFFTIFFIRVYTDKEIFILKKTDNSNNTKTIVLVAVLRVKACWLYAAI